MIELKNISYAYPGQPPLLQNISTTFADGKITSILGPNGCGKSTTLKMLSKIMYPDKGSIETTGRISALIELGAGFHPDLSGRENIYINAAIFGLSKEEIDELYAILDQAKKGVEDG